MALAMATPEVQAAILRDMNFHQTPAHAAFLASIGWKTETFPTQQGPIRAYLKQLPLVPITLMKLQRVPIERIDWEWVHELERRYRVYETLVEPLAYGSLPTLPIPELVAHGFHTAKDFCIATKTRVLDLHLNPNQLLADMKPKARYNIRLAQKHGLITRITSAGEVARDSTHFNRYFQLLSTNARRIGMLLLPKTWIYHQLLAFDQTGFVIDVYHQDNLVATATFFISDTDCSYNLNGSTPVGRRLMAPTLAIWTAIEQAQRLGLDIFDFDGVYDERFPRQKFIGFSRFKAGFGGKEVYFEPMYRRNWYGWRY